ncbi:MAG TPA: GNAT family N-acetyltransferase [Rhizomicrobium sp.]|jgi:GNAT superfamily N-acetyltransferase
MSGFTIREARLPDDKPACLSFIAGLQRYEHRFEPDRRIDAAVAADYFAVLTKRVTEQQGRIFIAEMDGAAIGWAVFVVERNAIYVVEDERTYGYVAELFVNEEVRGCGIGRALIAACEAEGRALGLKLMMIGVLAGNRRTASIYAQAGYSPYATELRKYL